ncbi:carbohydrate esterase family 4 protein [Trematosphaeria pertusa]|uniref:chitin deacetylase n=1 Tax=Trematosphaeria pertusa TaxID=390896 RepID=A0A6A6J2X1_9PLEO|nr:carbohydrate esterase family 4 protein [Trematosphaeria pertusa]KAF2256250.1 carbohydrate esterase family 4 protein [Trematosphaeria pertusa]
MIIILTVFLSLIAPFYIIYKPPALLIKYFAYRWPDVLWRVATTEKIIALTIDDAPSEYTTQIMKILEENDAAATFFVIGGQVPGREEVLKELVQNGNELGNHAMHDEPSRSLSDADLIQQIDAVETMIYEAYDAAGIEHPPRYFRPGSGFFSVRMRERLKMLKYRLVLGNIYPHDPQIPYPNVNAAHILSMLQPGGIIICHDRRSWTIPMLKKVIPEIKRRGYQITTVSGLLNHAPIERGTDFNDDSGS